MFLFDRNIQEIGIAASADPVMKAAMPKKIVHAAIEIILFNRISEGSRTASPSGATSLASWDVNGLL